MSQIYSLPEAKSQSVRETVEQIYRDYENGNLDGVMAAFPDRFCFEWPFGPEGSTYAGLCRGKGELLELLQKIATDFRFNTYKSRSLLVDGNNAAAQVDVNLTSLKTGTTFDMTIAHFWTFENGEPVHLTEYMDNALVVRHLG